jgi:hypothetical protein
VAQRRTAGRAGIVGALGVVFGDIGTSPLYATRAFLVHLLALVAQHHVAVREPHLRRYFVRLQHPEQVVLDGDGLRLQHRLVPGRGDRAQCLAAGISGFGAERRMTARNRTGEPIYRQLAGVTAASSAPHRRISGEWCDTANHEPDASAATSPTRAGASSGSSKMAHSPHKNWRGCPMCKPHKRRGRGRAVRDPWQAVKATGRKRRIRRGDLGDAEER